MASRVDLPLSDLLVLDLTIARAGPTAVRQLADWGADVIAIAAPEDASEDRSPAAPEDASEDRSPASPDELNLHRNKRSLTIDLKRAAGRRLLHRLVEGADVLIENLRPPVKKRLGFDWPTLSARNPRLVMGSISGFGQDGPYAERGGVDQIAQGMGGMMSVTGLPGQGPVRAGVAISDIAAGLQLAIGILVALHERERTGRGRYVHTSLLESMIGVLDFQAARFTVAREVPPQAGNHHPTMGPMGLFETSDGFVNLAAPWGRLWTALCEAIERPELARDPRFRAVADRVANRAELDAEIAASLTSRPTAEWVERLNAAGVPAGPVHDVAQVFADPQVRHLGMATPVEHPVHGRIDILRNATRIEGVPDAIRRPSPARGEHSVEILTQFGVDAEEIARLRADGVV